jgi:hypothetical protein
MNCETYTGDRAFERILLPIFKYTPLISPLAKGGYEGGEAKASESRVYRGRRMSDDTLSPVQPQKFMNNVGEPFDFTSLAKVYLTKTLPFLYDFFTPLLIVSKGSRFYRIP